MMIIKIRPANSRRNPSSRSARPRRSRRTLQTPVSDQKVCKQTLYFMRRWTLQPTSIVLILNSNCSQPTISPCRRSNLQQPVLSPPFPPLLQIRQPTPRFSRPPNHHNRLATGQFTSPAASQRYAPISSPIDPRRKQQCAHCPPQAPTNTSVQRRGGPRCATTPLCPRRDDPSSSRHPRLRRRDSLMDG